VPRQPTISGRKGERGVIILLVAIVLLFVVGAMAVLAIDLVTFYTARSEAQLAADSAALAGARVLANSGMTSNPADATLASNAELLARAVASQVAIHNKVGGRDITSVELTISFPNAGSPAFGSNPQVTVQVTRNDLPTFFARIWGRATVVVNASATAEAYNPSGVNVVSGTGPPIAPVCVKPWLLPNLNPIAGPAQIFDPITGAIANPGLLGQSVGNFSDRCTGSCGAPVSWKYYPGDPSSFLAPTLGLPACSAGFNAYQNSIAGCVQTPIACNSTVNLDFAPGSRDAQTGAAVNCLTHSSNDKGDRVDTSIVPPPPPFQFLAGNDNPVVSARGTDVLVSDSLVTVPVFDSSAPWPPTSVPPSVQVIGFVQLFLNPDGDSVGGGGIDTTVINMAGCGTNATGQPILGNGASTIPVRLLTP
jgi:Putative Flp pilus-assembly TadE/G-like